MALVPGPSFSFAVSLPWAEGESKGISVPSPPHFQTVPGCSWDSPGRSPGVGCGMGSASCAHCPPFPPWQPSTCPASPHWAPPEQLPALGSSELQPVGGIRAWPGETQRPHVGDVLLGPSTRVLKHLRCPILEEEAGGCEVLEARGSPGAVAALLALVVAGLGCPPQPWGLELGEAAVRGHRAGAALPRPAAMSPSVPGGDGRCEPPSPGRTAPRMAAIRMWPHASAPRAPRPSHSPAARTGLERRLDQY